MGTDEQIDAAARHADLSCDLPSSVRPPDELLMEAEAAGEGEIESERVWLQRRLLVYAFAAGDPAAWETVAWRMLRLMDVCLPALLLGRCNAEREAIRGRAEPDALVLAEIARLERETRSPRTRRWLRALLGFWYPPERSGWVLKGTKRVYGMALAFHPALLLRARVSRDGLRALERAMSFSEVAEVFGEEPRGARARWHARMKAWVVDPVEAAGGTCRLGYSKHASTRAKYRAAQMGNRNRAGGRCA